MSDALFNLPYTLTYVMQPLRGLLVANLVRVQVLLCQCHDETGDGERNSLQSAENNCGE